MIETIDSYGAFIASDETGIQGPCCVLFTVFTPTYNRARTLHRVYESLCAQTMTDFEWLIVDDGSIDKTEALVKEWTMENRFPIRYIRQPNQGKHVAFNTGVANARGELFLSADSDDRFMPHALERFAFHWSMIPEEQRSGFVGATCLCNDESGALVGGRFPRDITDSDSAEIRYRYKVNGEKWGFLRTAVLKEYPFPAKGRKSGYAVIPEDVIWLRIAQRFKTRFFNESLRIYYMNDMGESIMRTPNAIGEVAWGFLELQRVILNTQWGFFKMAPFEFGCCSLRYARFAIHAGLSRRNAMAGLSERNAKRLVSLLWPVAVLIGFRDRLAGVI